MYQYDTLDQAIVDQRVAQFATQTERFLNGQLSEDEFKPLRLQNGLYVQRYAPMLRVAIPYGVLSSTQMRKLADIAQSYDKGYGHFTTRQNIQFNWVELSKAPAILAELAKVQMHAIQTSGNCIRNTTTDHLAGVAQDEAADPRPYAELIRQWSSIHPEFAFLPRKFKIAITASSADRAAIQVHDVGLRLRNANGAQVFDVYIGGGLGRTPVVAPLLRAALPANELFAYLDSVLRVYNRYGRRDNLYKARIKILVRELGAETFAKEVSADFEDAKARGLQEHLLITPSALARVAKHFVDPQYLALPDAPETLATALKDSPFFANWYQRNVHAHKHSGYAAVTLSLKTSEAAPGDATAEQMLAVANLAEQFSFSEIRVSHHQNLILPHVRQSDLPEVYRLARASKLATANIGLATDLIACPGGDFCALANAKSLPVAKSITQHLDAIGLAEEVGPLELNISGCINACGHHHVGNIGLLGVDKAGEETFQLLIGGEQGSSETQASIGKILGKALPIEELPLAIERLLRTYLALRNSANERFIEVVRRVGTDVFKGEVYGLAA